MTQKLYVIPCINSQFNIVKPLTKYILQSSEAENIAVIAYKDYEIDGFSTKIFDFNQSKEALQSFLSSLTYSDSNKSSEGKGCLEKALFEAMSLSWASEANKQLTFFAQKDPYTPNAPLNKEHYCALTAIEVLRQKGVIINGISLFEKNKKLEKIVDEYSQLYNIHQHLLMALDACEYIPYMFLNNGKMSISKFQNLPIKEGEKIEDVFAREGVYAKSKFYVCKKVKKLKKTKVYIGARDMYYFYVDNLETTDAETIYEEAHKSDIVKENTEILYVPLFT